MALTVERVRSRAELTEFIQLPRRLYSGMQGYVPPLDFERRQLLDPKRSAFFSHGYAAYWIARRDGRAVGRISAQIDFLTPGPDADRLGLFGCLDAVDDGEVVRQLLETAERWLLDQKRVIVRGPFLLSINGESGLLLDGHNEEPSILLGWHPRYLQRHLIDRGYALAAQLRCYSVEDKDFAWHDELASLEAVSARAGLAVRHLDLRNLEADIEAGCRIFNDGWKDNWGFTPISQSDARALAARFRPLLFEDAAIFIDVRGEPAAFVLCAPNLFEISADLGGAPTPLGWLRLAYRIWRAQYRCVRLVLLGVTSKYRDTVLGGAIATLAFTEISKLGLKWGIETLVAGWILDSNRRTLRAVEGFGFRYSRSYGVYEKALLG